MKSNARVITAPLPFFLRPEYLRGNAFSACKKLACWALLLAGGPVLASPQLNEQIDHAVRDYFTQHLTALATAEHWQGWRFTQKVFALPPHSPTTSCPQPLQRRNSQQPGSPLGRQRITLICPASPGWSIEVTAQASVFIQAVVTAQVVERGQLITTGMLIREEVPVSRQNPGFYHHTHEVTGLSAKRRLRPHQVLTQDLLTTPWLVRRGERVTVAARHGEIQATAPGEALENGRQGMVIRVRNLGSGKIIDAKVTDTGEVSSTFERPQK